MSKDLWVLGGYRRDGHGFGYPDKHRAIPAEVLAAARPHLNYEAAARVVALNAGFDFDEWTDPPSGADYQAGWIETAKEIVDAAVVPLDTEDPA